MTAATKDCGAPLSCNRQEADGGSANKTYPSANISVSIRARPRPEGVFTRAIVEELIRRSPFVPHLREALDELEARGIIVVVDELPTVAVGMRQKGVA